MEQTAKGVAVSVIASTPEVAVAAVGSDWPGRAGHDRIACQNLAKRQDLEQSDRDGSRVAGSVNARSRRPPALPLARQSLDRIALAGRGRLAFADAVSGESPCCSNTSSAGAIRVLRDRSGCIWLGGDHINAYDCGSGAWPQVQFGGAEVRANLREATDRSMLLMGYNILAVGRPGGCRVAKLDNGLPVLLAALKGRDGTIWLGGTQGLYRFAWPFDLEFWTPREGINAAWCVQRDAQNVFAGLERNVAVLTDDLALAADRLVCRGGPGHERVVDG